ncbi:MAG: hypothetical protein A2X90_03455 [Deltaproteobacteria bacterium GWA2_65_63]|nr:MAG: hypothetical protein A2X90_03455 [Deltaproteobacteria bacterium GWA2_65_63]
MNATILVVEDNEQIRVLLRDFLASKGYRTKGIRMLALSGFLQLEDEGNFFRDGFDGHIAKPIDIRQLSAIVKKHLGTE